MSRHLSNSIVDMRLISDNRTIKRIGDVIKAKIKCKWFCLVCDNEWSASPDKILNAKQGCPMCSGTVINNETVDKKLKNTGIIRLGDVLGCKIKCKFACEKCGHVWETDPGRIHTRKCLKCYGKLTCNNETVDFRIKQQKREDLIRRIGNASNVDKKIEWECLVCDNTWFAKPDKVIGKEKTGCPLCRCSKGELQIKNWLDVNKIKFHYQYKIEECKNIFSLPFDFAIFNPDGSLRCLIEYDGKQHFCYKDYVKMFKFSVEKAKELLEKNKTRDFIKTQYCRANNIPLLRIPYWKFNEIPEVLFEFLEPNLL